MNRLSPLWLATLAALALTTTSAHAQLFLTLHLTGALDAGCTLNGTPLGAVTPFSISANFDTSGSTYPPTSGGIFPISTFSVTLGGNTYTGIPDNNRYGVGFLDPVFVSGPSTVGIIEFSGFAKLIGFFNSTTSPFSGALPTPTVFSGFVDHNTNPILIDLVGFPGGLAVVGGPNLFPWAASVTASAVPEPSEYAAVVGLALGAFALVRRGRKASTQVG